MTRGKYTVNEVEERTKVPASTLRQWERRYGFPKPERSESGYRLYSDADLGHIDAMKRHIAEGIPASRAAELVGGRLPLVGSARPLGDLQEELVASLVGFDEESADRLLSEAHALHTVDTVVLRLMAGALERIGDLWEQGSVGVAAEHFASSYLLGRLRGLMALAPGVRSAPAVVLACAPGNRHEFGPLMAALMLRRSGFRTCYLGADMPTGELAAVASRVRPLAVMLSAADDGSQEALRREAQRLVGLAPIVGYGGAAFDRDPLAADRLGGIYLGPDVAAGIERFRQRAHALEIA